MHKVHCRKLSLWCINSFAFFLLFIIIPVCSSFKKIHGLHGLIIRTYHSDQSYWKIQVSCMWRKHIFMYHHSSFSTFLGMALLPWSGSQNQYLYILVFLDKVLHDCLHINLIRCIGMVIMIQRNKMYQNHRKYCPLLLFYRNFPYFNTGIWVQL